MGSLFESKTETDSTSRTIVPKAFQNFLDMALGKATAAGNKEFTRYTAPRIAELSSNEQAGINAAGANAGMYQPLVDMAMTANAQNLASQGAPTQTELGNFINPYVNYVLGNSLDRLQEQSDINMTKIGSQAAMSGAFGNLRHGVLEGANLAELLKSARDLSGSTYSDAFDKGMGNWFRSKDLQRGNISDALNIVRQGQAYNQGDIDTLMKTGLVGRTRDQAGLDFGFSEFMREDQDPFNKASFLSTIAAQYPRDLFTRTSHSETTQSDSPIKTLAGIGLAAAGIMSGNPAAALSLSAGSSALGKSPETVYRPSLPYNNAEGGLIKTKKYADGGMVKAGLSILAGDDPLSAAMDYMDERKEVEDKNKFSLGGILAFERARGALNQDLSEEELSDYGPMFRKEYIRRHGPFKNTMQAQQPQRPFDFESFFNSLNLGSFTRPSQNTVNPNFTQPQQRPDLSTYMQQLQQSPSQIPLRQGLPGPGGFSGLNGTRLFRKGGKVEDEKKTRDEIEERIAPHNWSNGDAIKKDPAWGFFDYPQRLPSGKPMPGYLTRWTAGDEYSNEDILYSLLKERDKIQYEQAQNKGDLRYFTDSNVVGTRIFGDRFYNPEHLDFIMNEIEAIKWMMKHKDGRGPGYADGGLVDPLENTFRQYGDELGDLSFIQAANEQEKDARREDAYLARIKKDRDRLLKKLEAFPGGKEGKVRPLEQIMEDLRREKMYEEFARHNPIQDKYGPKYQDGGFVVGGLNFEGKKKEPKFDAREILKSLAPVPDDSFARRGFSSQEELDDLIYDLAVQKHETAAKEYNNPNYRARPKNKKGEYLSSAFGLGQWILDNWNIMAANPKNKLPFMTEEDLNKGNFPTKEEQDRAWKAWQVLERNALGADRGNPVYRFAHHQLGRGDFKKMKAAYEKDPNIMMRDINFSKKKVPKNVGAEDKTVGQYLRFLDQTVKDAEKWYFAQNPEAFQRKDVQRIEPTGVLSPNAFVPMGVGDFSEPDAPQNRKYTQAEIDKMRARDAYAAFRNDIEDAQRDERQYSNEIMMDPTPYDARRNRQLNPKQQMRKRWALEGAVDPYMLFEDPATRYEESPIEDMYVEYPGNSPKKQKTYTDEELQRIMKQREGNKPLNKELSKLVDSATEDTLNRMGLSFTKGGKGFAKGGKVPTPRAKPTDTVLTPKEEKEFQKWKQKYAPNDSGQDYDLRGAFKEGLTPDKNGHWSDKYKKPWHPTFSNESKYYELDPLKAGRWEGNNFVKKYEHGGEVNLRMPEDEADWNTQDISFIQKMFENAHDPEGIGYGMDEFYNATDAFLNMFGLDPLDFTGGLGSTSGKTPSSSVVLPINKDGWKQEEQPFTPSGNFSPDPGGILGPWFDPERVDPVDSFYDELNKEAARNSYFDVADGSPLDEIASRPQPSMAEQDFNELAQMFHENLQDYKKYKKPEKEKVFGLFGDVNEPLLKLGLSLLASKGSFGQALGEAGLSSLKDREAKPLQDQAEKSAKLKELMSMWYQNAMIQSMDPNVRKQLAREKAQAELLKEDKKNIAKLKEAQLKYNQGIEKEFLKSLIKKMENSDYVPSKAEQEMLSNLGMPWSPALPPGEDVD